MLDIILDSLVFIFSVILLFYFISISVNPMLIILEAILAVEQVLIMGIDIWRFRRKKKKDKREKDE
jgi:hypothetical protein